MINKQFRQILTAFLLILAIAGRGYCQTNVTDSLELTPLINKVIQTYPTIQQAAEALTAADLKIELARSAYLPNAMVSGSLSHIGPVPSLTLPDVGSFSLAPHNPVNASLNINQTLTDFGKTRKNIEYEEKSKQLASLGMEQIKQKMALAVIGCYYNLLFYQEAVVLKDQQLTTLGQHLKNVEMKAETGSATQYEILSTKVRISNIESQKTDVITALNFQNSYLNMLLGESPTSQHRVKNALSTDLIPFGEDSLIRIALNNRNEMKIVEKKMVVSQAYQDLVKTHENPVLSAFATGGWKNGYIPELEKSKANYAVGLSLQIPIFDANRTSLNSQLAGSALRSVSQEVDLTKRTITNEVMESINTLKAAISKTELFSMQLSQAKRALELADLKYKSGTLTNLDLLDAENAVSESSLLYLKARIDRVVVGYRLKSVLGTNLY
ncbi:MAG TPA: TolC family protein [Prolixibacteraceae bacterium]